MVSSRIRQVKTFHDLFDIAGYGCHLVIAGFGYVDLVG